MTKGDTFSMTGYDLVAHADVAEGGGDILKVLVLNNNSNWYIVAYQSMGHNPDMATYIDGVTYGDDDESVIVAYRLALERMVHFAMAH